MKLQLIQGDCLEKLQDIPDQSVDMVLVDPPYGTTACKWDSIIPLEPMWQQVLRVARPRAALVFMASQPFTSVLISSNLKMFKYVWYWKKSKASNFLHAPNMPLKIIEEIAIFSRGSMGHRSLLGEKRMDARTNYATGYGFAVRMTEEEYQEKCIKYRK